MEVFFNFIVKGLEVLAQNWAIGVLFIGSAIALYRAFEKRIDKVDSKLDFVLESKEKINYVVNHFGKIKEVTDLLNNPDSFSSVIDTLISNVINQLNANFSNGSSLEKGLSDVEDFFNQAVDMLNNRSDIQDKDAYMILLEVIHEELIRLTNQLALLTDYTVKPKLIIPYGKNLRALMDYFEISLQKKYQGIPDKAIRIDLINRLRLYGSRLENNRSSFSPY